MQEPMKRALSLPRGLPTVRHRPKPQVEIPAGVKEIPLIDKNTPEEEQIQEHWIAHAKVFDLTDDTQLAEYEGVWQLACDNLGRVVDNQVEFHDGKYLAYLRWAEFSYKLPGDKGAQ